MANIDFTQQMRQGVDALSNNETLDPAPACHAGDLKGLLNAIVDQISEADRRHSDTLAQLQNRMAGIGREAKAIKPRVPESYAAAFERIEAGMSELATRIAEASDSRTEAADHTHGVAAALVPSLAGASLMNYAPVSNVFEPPAALRSASDTVSAATRRREEEAVRAHTGVDTFDVIETSLPGNVTDPWDRDSAEALTGLYESASGGFSSKAMPHDLPKSDVRSAASSFAAIPVQAAVPGVDHIWLESRFAEISKRIDESLSEIRPDQGFFAVGQRIDQLEQHFSNLIEGVATRGDVEGVRLIEAHVSELAGHLENAHQQLMRLDAIEDHLVGIAGKLEDVHRAALMGPDREMRPMAQAPEIDMHSFARTAAEAAAQQFAKLQQPAHTSSETGELRDTLRGFISESRQGEENTTALLDTLQQAMIRLLDRVDSMELNAIHSAQAHTQSAPQEYVREQVRFNIDHSRGHGHDEGHPVTAIDAAVAAVASAKSMASPFAQSPGGPDMAGATNGRYGAASEAAPHRSPEKLRQDFIAEVRRAKMRLANEDDADATVPIATPLDPALAAEAAKAGVAAARGKPKVQATDASRAVAQPALTPRLKVLALGAVVAIASGWYVTQLRHVSVQPVSAAVSADDLKTKAAVSSDVAKSSEKEAKSDMATGAGAAVPSQAEPEAGSSDGGASPLNLKDSTRGEITTEPLTVGSASVPLYGVTVDSEKPMTSSEIARAKRQQAIAAVSAQLGQAAQQNPAAPAMLAALQQNGGAQPGSGLMSIEKSNMSQSSALDLPPATVGPLSLRLAAANGDASAQFEVGARLAEGKGTDQNFKDAAKWYQRSAAQGFAQAQYRLGTLYERGLGLKAEQARAEDWYKRAADQGNTKAMHNLAVLSANQSKGAPDYATAAAWFEKAAEHGLSDSQFNLAVLHENGLGVDQDLTTAYKWLALAAKSGDKEAVRRRDILKGKMTAEQLAKAETMVTTWKATLPDPLVNDARKAGEAWKKNPANGVNG